MWKYSFCAAEGAADHEPVLFRGPYCDVFAHARALGYDGVEIHLRDATDVDGDMLLRESERSGVAVAAIATGLAKRVDGLSLVDDDDGCRRRAVARIKGHLALASRFSCPVIIGSMRGNIDRPARRNVIVERLADALQEITAYAADKRCSVVLEAINRYENNYLNTAAETAAFVERIGSPKLGVLLDTFHMNIEESNNHAAIRAAGAGLKHFHIGENTRWYPGHGQIDFRAILQTLRDIGYVGWISMEYLPQPNEIEAARQGARFAGWARKAFA